MKIVFFYTINFYWNSNLLIKMSIWKQVYIQRSLDLLIVSLIKKFLKVI